MTEVLDVAEHFEALRGPVWARFRARHPAVTRDRFEDVYAEWWTREVERAAEGRPTEADAPVAFVAEAVHRVLLDEGRARARGLARGDEKAALALLDLDDQVDVAGADDVLAAAHYEALVHRVLEVVRGRLTEREMRIFVFSFLYLRSTPATAAALGLSEPRVKKDRKRIATKVGEEVWAVLSRELSCDAAYSDKGLLAVCEHLVDHVEECPSCAESVGGLRRGALAIVPPFELLALAAALDAPGSLVARLCSPVQRLAESAASVPPGGRAAAAAAVVATGLGGGVVASKPEARAIPPRAAVAATATPTPTAPATPTATPTPVRTAAPRSRRERVRERRRRKPEPRDLTFTPTPAATVAAASTPPPPPVTSPAPAPARPAPAAPPAGEFGFERP